MMRLLLTLVLTVGILLPAVSPDEQRLYPRNAEERVNSSAAGDPDEGDIDYNDPLLKEAEEFLRDHDRRADLLAQASSVYEFTFNTDVTDDNSKKVEDQTVINGAFMDEQKFKAEKYYRHSRKWPFTIQRQLQGIAEAVVPTDPAMIREMAELNSNLTSIYANAQVCKTEDNSCYSFEPDLVGIMHKSRDYDELLWAWKGWHDATGPKMKPLYTRLVQLMNNVSQVNGFKDEAAVWMKDNDETDPAAFESKCDKMLGEVTSLYRELHAYVRGRLERKYGEHHVKYNKPIPIHLLGNMWAQDWSSLNPVVNPYPNKLFQEADKGMLERNLTVLDLVKLSEEFYTSVDMPPMTDAFWRHSMFTKPTDARVVQCHAAAHDMSTGSDFRLHMCAEVNMDSFYVIHHEMGHIEYFMAYANLSHMFRVGAHSGFHEAIGDTIGLSVVTPKHLATIGLVDAGQDTFENSISFLLNLALQKVAFLPFGYLIDKWRWRVFRGEIRPEDYTKSWWHMHEEYRGVAPAVPRDDPRLFDPGAKYHVPGNVPYIRYFISHLLQFHFHEALCNVTGHVGPLHKCDIYRSKAAGRKLLKTLQMGASRPWPDALETLTGSRTFETGPLLRYFEPLRLWLIEQNRHNRYHVGWTPKATTTLRESSHASSISHSRSPRALHLAPLLLLLRTLPAPFSAL